MLKLENEGMEHCCFGHGKAVFIGILFIIVALAMRYGVSLANTLLLIGVILIAKGLLMMFLKK